MKKVLCYFLILFFVGFVASYSVDSVFSELKFNEEGVSKFVFNNPTLENIPLSDFKLKYRADCGKIVSYSLYSEGLCDGETTTYKRVCKEFSDSKNLSSSSSCYDVVDVVDKYTYPCLKRVYFFRPGVAEYVLRVNLKMGLCDDKTFGYKIDWIPEVTIGSNVLTKSEWAWWNVTWFDKYPIYLNLSNELNINHSDELIKIDIINTSCFNDSDSTRVIYNDADIVHFQWYNSSRSKLVFVANKTLLLNDVNEDFSLYCNSSGVVSLANRSIFKGVGGFIDFENMYVGRTLANKTDGWGNYSAQYDDSKCDSNVSANNYMGGYGYFINDSGNLGCIVYYNATSDNSEIAVITFDMNMSVIGGEGYVCYGSGSSGSWDTCNMLIRYTANAWSYNNIANVIFDPPLNEFFSVKIIVNWTSDTATYCYHNNTKNWVCPVVNAALSAVGAPGVNHYLSFESHAGTANSYMLDRISISNSTSLNIVNQSNYLSPSVSSVGDMVVAHSLSWYNQTPSYINYDTLFFNVLNISYNYTPPYYWNTSTKYLFWKTNNSDRDYSSIINGSVVQGYSSLGNGSNLSEISYFELDYNLYPHTGNLPFSEFASTAHFSESLGTDSILSMVDFNNFSSYDINLVGFMANSTSNFNVYVCNGSYISGVVVNSDFCLKFGFVEGYDAYDVDYNSNSKHFIRVLPINNSKYHNLTFADGVLKLVFISGGGLVNVYYINNATSENKTLYSIDGGGTWINRSFTIDAVVYQYNGSENLTYYACGNTTDSSPVCSATYHSKINFDNIPPGMPVIYEPSESYYYSNITNFTLNISYLNSFSPVGSIIQSYNISLYNSSMDYLFSIHNNSLNLSYIWNYSGVDEGYYYIRVDAYDSFGVSAFDYSVGFYLLNATELSLIINPDGGSKDYVIPVGCSAYGASHNNLTYHGVAYYGSSSVELFNSSVGKGFFDMGLLNYSGSVVFGCSVYNSITGALILDDNSSIVYRAKTTTFLLRPDMVRNYYFSSVPYQFNFLVDMANNTNISIKALMVDCDGDGLYDYFFDESSWSIYNPPLSKVSQSFWCQFPRFGRYNEVLLKVAVALESSDAYPASLGNCNHFSNDGYCFVSKEYPVRVLR